MFESERARTIKIFGNILLLFLVLVIISTYLERNSNVKVVSGTLGDVLKKSNIFVWSKTKDTEKKKTMLKSESNTKYPESELDIKFLVIGVKKCGSKAFQTYVSQHPDINIFTSDSVCTPYPQSLDSIKPTLSFLEQANQTNQIAIVENHECLHNINEFDRLKKPSKIILLLCDPTLRAFSDYKEILPTLPYREPFASIVSKAITLIDHHKDDHNFAEFISRFRYQGHLDYSIVSVGFYYEYVKEFFKRYKREDILILSGTELKQEPYSVMYQLESFLGVRHYLDKSKFFKDSNSDYYCVRQTLGTESKCTETNNSQEVISPDLATTEKLKKLYQPYNEKLFQLLNQKFAWI